MNAIEFENERTSSEFWPRATSSPSSQSNRNIKSAQETLRNALTPSSSTYVKYGANDLELTTSNVRLVATPTRSQLEAPSMTSCSVSKKRKLNQSTLFGQNEDMEKILRKINSSIMKNVEKRRGCSFNSQKNMKDNMDFLKTAFRQTSGSTINNDFNFDNKHSFDLIWNQMNHFMDSQATQSKMEANEINTLEMLDSINLSALPSQNKRRRAHSRYSSDRLNFKRGKLNTLFLKLTN